MMSCLAVIPARSGSKRLKDKNIKLLNGKPMLAYTIEAAEGSGVFDQINVSTDSEHYAEIARQYGADVPFLRSEDLSSDSSGSWDVVKEVLSEYKKMGQTFDLVALLQSTSPLRDSDDIRKAMALYQDKDAKAVVSVCEVEYSPSICGKISDDLSMDGFMEYKRERRNHIYRLNGAIYILNCEFLLESESIYRTGCYAYIMSREKSIDIDTPFDFKIAEYIMSINARN